MKRVWSIQYLRACAAFGVVVFHTLESTNHRFAVGAAGVDIFFVISGFIMASLMLGDENQPWQFFRRRITRIVPLYWLVTFAAIAITFIKPNFFYRMDTSLHNVVLSLFFIPHESVRPNGVAPVLWQGWTLEYEMFFYALCAASLTLPERYRLTALMAALCTLAAAGFLMPAEGAIARVYTNQLLLEFLAGIGLGLLWRRRIAPPSWLGALAIALGFGVYALEQMQWIPETGLRIVDWGFPAILIVAGALGLEANDKVPHSRIGLLLGDASYSLYLTHGFVVSLFLWRFAGADLSLRVLCCVLGAAVLSVVTHLIFEKPTTRTLNSLVFARVNPRTPVG